MKAIIKRTAAPGLEIGEIPKPQAKEGQVLIKIAATGICGSDLHMYHWTKGYEFVEPYMPLAIGHEFSGTVVELGEGTDKSWLGKKVVCRPGTVCGSCRYCLQGQHNLCQNKRTIGLHINGAYTEYIAVPVINCYVVPDSLDFEVAALAEPLAVCVHATELAKITVGDSVVVIGPGTIGLMCAYLAKLSGATRVILTGTSKDKERLAIGRLLGADTTVVVDNEDPIQVVQDLTGGCGADCVIEASGFHKSVMTGLQMLKKGGTQVVVAIHSEPAALEMNTIVRLEKRLIGSYSQTDKDWRRTVEILSQGSVQLAHLITGRVPLEEGLRAFEIAQDPQEVKVMIIS